MAHDLLVLALAGGIGSLVSIGFWLIVAKDEFIDSCRRYVTEDDDPDYSTFPPKSLS